MLHKNENQAEVSAAQASKMVSAGPGHLRQAAPARLYHKEVVDRYENPGNVGSLDKTCKNVRTGLVGAPAYGDIMKLQL